MSVRTTPRAFIGDGLVSVRGRLVYDVKSEDRREIRHRVWLDVGSGEIGCTCEHFKYKCARSMPTLWSGRLCKHLNSIMPEFSRAWAAENSR